MKANARMTDQDALEWCAAREVSVIFRQNGTMSASVVLLVHGTPVKAEKPTLPEAVEEASMRLSRFWAAEREQIEHRRLGTPGATRKPTMPDIRIP